MSVKEEIEDSFGDTIVIGVITADENRSFVTVETHDGDGEAILWFPYQDAVRVALQILKAAESIDPTMRESGS